MAQLTFVDGDVLTASQINTYLMGEGGAWTSYTPTVAQGASSDIAKTVNYSKYARYGRTIHWTFDLTMTAAGSAGQAITVTLPVAAASTSSVRGSGEVYDASVTTHYVCTVYGPSTASCAFVSAGVTADTAVGVGPGVTVASGDILRGSITYEAAS